MRTVGFIGLLLFLICASPVLADTRLALVVANSRYDAAPLSNPVVDAGLVEKALADVGFDVTLVEDATLGQFDSALADFAMRAKGADLALFYYAGHGFAVSDRGSLRNYLMSVDADVTSTSERVLRAGGMPLDDVIHAISEQARTTLVFIDACRNDPRVSRALGTSGRSAVPIDNTIGESIFVGLSTRSGDVAQDGAPGDGSPFARAFAAKIGMPVNSSVLDPAQQRGLTAGYTAGVDYVETTTRSRRASPWAVNTKVGRFGTDYVVRAATAAKGLGGLAADEALYAAKSGGRNRVIVSAQAA